MAVASTVTGLGTPSQDGTAGILRIGSGATAQDELLIWDAAQQAWIGRPRVSVKQVATISMKQSGSQAAWQYLALGPNEADADSKVNANGFQLYHLSEAKARYDAGLRLQENLSAVFRSGGGADMQLAMNWFELDDNDGFLSPSPTNLGAVLTCPAWTDTGVRVRRFMSTGWQNTPIAAPTKAHWYPNAYVKNSAGFSIERMFHRHRWVAGTLGSTGGSDNSAAQPPIWNQILGWYTADAVPLADGTALSEWADYSGWPTSRALVQATAGARPLLVKNALNGHAVVRFDGVNDFMSFPATVGEVSQPVTIFVVMKQYSGGGTQQVWIAGGAGTSPLFYRDTGTDKVNLWCGGTDITYNRGTAWPSGYVCFVGTENGASSTIHENKTLKVTGNPGTTGIAGLSVGGRNDGTLPAQIDVAEVLVYYSALSNTDRDAVVDYLNAKYALF